MNAPLPAEAVQAHDLAEHIARACARIAPTWPLDRFIAVNPYWGWREQPMPAAGAALGALSGTRLAAPRELLRTQWHSGALRADDLRQAIELSSSRLSVDALVVAMFAEPEGPARLPLLADLAGGASGQDPQGWRDRATHQISQHCAAFFDADRGGQGLWNIDRSTGLFGSWRRQLAADRGLPWQRGSRWIAMRLATLPVAPLQAIAAAADAIGIEAGGRADYFTALLLSINGWASWCAYVRWQAQLAGGSDDRIVELLAIRVTWEWLLNEDAGSRLATAEWLHRWSAAARQSHLQAVMQGTSHECDWLLQLAAECAYQRTLGRQLLLPAPQARPAPRVQAVFCIDVRSEVYRRALEAASPLVQTRGFAGFFGLPIAYAPLGTALERPQLPGLLRSGPCVSESCESPALGQVIAQRRRQTLQWHQRWADFRKAAGSAFTFVESLGLRYGVDLLRDSLPNSQPAVRWEDTALTDADRARLRPRLEGAARETAAALAQGVLTAMGLLRDFAPLVLLAGHGSQSANNAHAAGLDCGACGGQSGEVNARVLADLLNDPELRLALRELGIDIPADTHFVPGLHNTTTDDVSLFDTDAVPQARRDDLALLQEWLAAAADAARAERAPRLGLAALVGDKPALARSLRQRANDWAQVRPEWGLADNAAFIVAPRDRSRAHRLGGRSFLHDYDHRLDPTLGVLELIMTAPMVVAHWINMQYHASSIDPLRYGSGNKVLHNVVGGHLGVFEGNGGDLRIGLPWQSVHDGRRLQHQPLRLSVYIEAPRGAIEAIIGRHELLQQLLHHDWLHLFQIEPGGSAIARYRQRGWIDETAALRES